MRESAGRVARQYLGPVRLALLVALPGLLAGCGDDPPAAGGPAPQVLLVACGLDGPPPTTGLRVQNLRKDAPPGPEIPLVPVPGRPGVYDAPGAVDGLYHLLMPAGWGHLISDRVPFLQPGGNPARFVVGRAHTLYAGSHVRGRTLGDEWGVRRIEPSGVLGARLDVRVEQDADLGLTLVRFRPEDWPGNLAYQARFLDGGLTEVVITTFKDAHRPVFRELEPEPLGPLRVTPAASRPVPDDALWVHAEVEGLPLAERQQRPVRGGRADFPGIPMGGTGVRVTLGEEGAASSLLLEPREWTALGDVRVWHGATGAEPATWIPVEWSGDAAGLRVQIRDEAGSSYGLVPTRSQGGTHSALVPAGRWRLLATGAAGSIEGTADTSRGPSAAEVRWSPPVAWAVVQGLAAGGAGRRIAWSRREGAVSVLAHGFVLRADSGGRFKGRLPPGVYDVAVEAADGSFGRPKRVTLEPGGHLSLPLDA